MWQARSQRSSETVLRASWSRIWKKVQGKLNSRNPVSVPIVPLDTYFIKSSLVGPFYPFYPLGVWRRPVKIIRARLGDHWGLITKPGNSKGVWGKEVRKGTSKFINERWNNKTAWQNEGRLARRKSTKHGDMWIMTNKRRVSQLFACTSVIVESIIRSCYTCSASVSQSMPLMVTWISFTVPLSES